ncbi:hypothetical protein [Halosimplex pelagicum]|uniref:Uncharacterized protein n=1 Tax=Halosimplex pelagicum TaxID=869886 RepID=A0A7D5TU73_9EURY|nr:hypothetical protein [Halosimplex pelagicum]QLH82074.1 hypothetical protein HZS54_10860 [Halosimplex pelagicum]
MNDIHTSVEKVFNRYRREVTTASLISHEISESIPDRVLQELDERGIERTGGVSEMILRRSGTDSLNTSSEFIDSILDETLLNRFDKLADWLYQDISELKDLEYNNTPAVDVLKIIHEKENSQGQNQRAVDISTDLKGVHKKTVGALLLKISNTPKAKPPWTQRPLIQVNPTNTSRTYSLTQYGKLTLISLFEPGEEHREWLHTLASHEDQKNSNYSSKMELVRSDSHPISNELSLAKEALKEVK